MKLNKLLIHFTGLRNLFISYIASIVGVVKAIAIIVGVLVVFAFVSKGSGGVVLYLKSIDVKTILIMLITLMFVFSFFALCSIVSINFISSVRFCKAKNMTLNEFYSMSDKEILERWGYGKYMDIHIKEDI